MSQDDTYRGDPPPGYGPPPGWGPPPGYGQTPGCGAPGYPPPGYGPPGHPQTWRRPTNTMAVLALVAAFVIPPAGIVLGILARRQIAQTGEEGAGLALAGLIVGSIATAFYALLVLVWIAAVASLTGGAF